MDILSKERRSDHMRRIRGKNTKPEMIVRRVAHALGYRYRLHDSELPGSPDLVFAKHRKVIFVHGCFWHNHAHCSVGRVPDSNREYWLRKFRLNKLRDANNKRALRRLGWQYLVLWECTLSNERALRQEIVRFLESRS
jgi:DNA mismatch endonuclease (patch repair protein)